MNRFLSQLLVFVLLATMVPPAFAQERRIHSGDTLRTLNLDGRNTVNVDRRNDRMGVGTQSPTARFEVKGVGNSSGTQALRVLNSADEPLMMIRDDGAVGIGGVPYANLSVYGNMKVGPYQGGENAGRPDNFISVGSRSLSETAGLFFPLMDGTQNTRAWLSVDPGNNRLDLNHTWSTGGDLSYHFNRDRFVIENTGMIGIGGVTNPQHLIDMGDGLGRKLALWQRDAGDAFYGFGVSANTLEVHAASSAVADPAMVVRNNGHVGIGTTSPSNMLSVEGGNVWVSRGDASPTLTLDSQGSTTEEQVLYFRNTGAAPGRIQYSQDLKLQDSSGDVHLFVDKTDDQVGIGTEIPHHLLDLGTALGKKLAVYQNALGNAFYGLGVSAATLEFHAGSASDADPAMVIKSDGKIGMGTTNPVSNLDIPLDNAEAVHIGDMRLLKYQGANFIQPGRDGRTGRTSLHFSNYNSSNPFFSLHENGNVGIQNAVPQYPLDISVGGNSDVARFRAGGAPSIILQTGSNGVGPGNIKWNRSDGSTAAEIGAGLHVSSVSQRFMTFTVNEVERMRFAPYGFTGIGTATPVSKLEVSGSTLPSFEGRGKGVISVSGGDYVNGAHTIIDFTNATAAHRHANARIGVQLTNEGSYLKFGTSNDYSEGVTNTALVIDPEGLVGVGGTPSSTETFQVTGSAGKTQGGTSWTSISDARLKTVLGQVDNAAELIQALNPVRYEWNEQGPDDPGVKYGFLAQELMQVIPEMVHQDQNGRYWYNPSGIEAILAAALQEQQQEIDQLKALVCLDHPGAEVCR